MCLPRSLHYTRNILKFYDSNKTNCNHIRKYVKTKQLRNLYFLKLHILPIRTISSDSVENIILQNQDALKLHLDSLTDNYRSDRSFSKSNLQAFKKNQLLSSRVNILDNLASLEELKLGMEDDKEMKAQIESEKTEYIEKLQRVDRELVNYLVPVEPFDEINDVIIEIRAGVGGQEAMLFANNLLEMYCGYASYKGWDHYVDDLSVSDLGGIRSGSISVSGGDALKHYCYEAGVHRVQRVPLTEKYGRIHTSAVSVSVMAQPSEVEVDLHDKDLKFEAKRASGPGGQSVNKTDSAVRITHLPTGIAVECQTERSQIKNKSYALKKLRAKLYQIQVDEQMKNVSRTRKFQIQCLSITFVQLFHKCTTRFSNPPPESGASPSSGSVLWYPFRACLCPSVSFHPCYVTGPSPLD
ncbi:peptide chain release factor 1-like isoform X2 [Nilaparvata lugens]|uniref:peptide chain release factor 1-like isoform X2 n=1 Tax=Nilaparvata lugens TaxID=108931 RepID=UPI00193D3442|nr:peptide chain release factor 1-like isoform X2 [Nilaparvata lugens]